MRTLVVTLLAIVAVAGCRALESGTPRPSPAKTPTTSPRPSASAPASASEPPSASPEPDGLRELTADPAPLPAGTYTLSAFRPRVTLELDGSWTSVNRFADFFDVERDVGSPDVIAVQVARPKGIVGAAAGPARAADPVAAVAALRSNPDLTVLAESASKLGGLDGRVVEIENRSGHHAGVVELGPGTLGIDSGRKLWLAFLATPDGLVAVMVGGSVARWDAALAAAEPVLGSIRFPDLVSPPPSS